MDFPIECNIDWLKEKSKEDLIKAMIWFKQCYNPITIKTQIIIDNNDNNKINTITNDYEHKLLQLTHTIDTNDSKHNFELNKLNDEILSLNSKLITNKRTIDDKVNEQISLVTYKHNVNIDHFKSQIEDCKLLREKSQDREDQLRLDYGTEIKSLNTIINQLKSRKSTSEIGSIGEQNVADIIDQLLPHYLHNNVGHIAQQGDIELIDPSNKYKYMIEVKNHKQCIRQKEIDKFIRDINCVKPFGAIFLSLKSSITGLQNKKFIIQVHFGIPCVYIPHFLNNSSSLVFAIDTIKSINKYSVNISQYCNIDDLINNINNELTILESSVDNAIKSNNDTQLSLIKIKNQLQYDKCNVLLKNFFDNCKKSGLDSNDSESEPESEPEPELECNDLEPEPELECNDLEPELDSNDSESEGSDLEADQELDSNDSESGSIDLKLDCNGLESDSDSSDLELELDTDSSDLESDCND